MNENIDLTKILKDCPIGWKLYSPLSGEVEFEEIRALCLYPIITSYNERAFYFTKKGLYYDCAGAECLLFPSAEQRDWSKFTAPWYKKERFDTKTLQPFDKVLVRDDLSEKWRCDFFSHIYNDSIQYPYFTIRDMFKYCIPYNDDTRHHLGTTEEAPEFYRYWDD